MEARWRRAAAYVVCRDDADRILLTRFVLPGNPDSGRWTMPGGGMEWGESPVDTALRELAEETGLEARIGPVLGVFSHWFEAHEAASGEPGHVVGLVFASTELRGTVRTEFDEGTTDRAEWFSLEEVQALARVPLVDFVIELLHSG
jgi:8-oxo-dGTP diphosphatase